MFAYKSTIWSDPPVSSGNIAGQTTLKCNWQQTLFGNEETSWVSFAWFEMFLWALNQKTNLGLRPLTLGNLCKTAFLITSF